MSPAPPPPILELLRSDGPEAGRVYAISADTVIGRGEGCEIRIADDRLSRRHARIACVEGRWVVRDEMSTSGTYVNEQHVREPQAIVEGDEVRFGGIRFRVQRVHPPK